MYKIFLLPAILLALAGCSENKQSKAPSEPEVLVVYNATTVTGTGDFGLFAESKGSKVLTIRIKNDGPEVLIGPATVDSTNFSLIYQSGCASVAIGKTCTVKVVFDANNKPAQEYAGLLILGEAQVPLLAEIEAPEPPAASIQYNLSGVELSILDFGSFTGKQSSLKTISLKNTGLTPVTSSVVVSSNFTKTYDNCSAALAPGKSCSVKVSFSSAGKSGEVLGTLTFADTVLDLKAEVITPATTGTQTSNIVYIISSQQLVSPAVYDIGSKMKTESSQVIVYAKNIGTVASVASTAQLSDPSFAIAYNQCINRSLAPNATCQIRVTFSASGKAPADYSSVLTFAEKTLSFSATVLDPAGEITYEPVYSDYTGCSVTQACDGQGTESRNLNSCNKLVGGVVVESLDSSACPQFSAPEMLSRTCNSPSGSIVQEILDEGMNAGSLTISCSEGQSLAEGSRSVSCNLEHEQDGENCIKMYQLHISKPAGVGTITTSKSICDVNCTGTSDYYRRDQTADVVFSPEGPQFGFDQFAGNGEYCSGMMCSSIPMSGSKFLNVLTYERPVLVLNETADYSLSLPPENAYEIFGYSLTPGFTNTKAFYVEPNTSYTLTSSITSGSNVNTGWYRDAQLSPPPVANSLEVYMSDFSSVPVHSVHITVGAQNALCGNTLGEYFGVKPNGGTKAWDANLGEYSTRCIPIVKNSSSCIQDVYTNPETGVNTNYIYRTATLFPTNNDPQDPDPSYPYAQGACVTAELDCTSTVANAKEAVRYSFGGENQYQECQVNSCNDGYRNSYSSCSARKVYFSGTTAPGTNPNNIRSYDFSTDTVSQVSSTNANANSFFGPTLMAVDTFGTNLYYTMPSMGLVYKVNVDTSVATQIGDLSDFQAELMGEAVVVEDANRLFFNGNTFANGREVYYLSTTNSTPVAPSVTNFVTGAGAHGAANFATVFGVPGGMVYNFGINNATIGSEIGYLNPYSPATMNSYNFESAANSSVDSSVANRKSILYKDSYIYYTGTGSANGQEIYRISTSIPSSPGRVVWAETAASTANGAPQLLIDGGNKLFFRGTSGSETELYYKSFAAAPATAPTKIDLVPGATGVLSLTDMVMLKGKLYLALNISAAVGLELYEVSETSPGVFSLALISDINPTANASSSPQHMVTTGESIYFMATPASGILSLYKYDGTTLVNLTETKGIRPSNPGQNGRRMLVR